MLEALALMMERTEIPVSVVAATALVLFGVGIYALWAKWKDGQEYRGGDNHTTDRIE